jgi:hypothetical protein
MPRNSSGTYTLPIGAFSPGGLIKSSDHNSNYGDIATALTQSLATTGVSTMTGPIKAAAGNAAAPSITFSGGSTNGLFLAGTNQVGLATNGTQAATFNSDQSVTWAGNATWGGNAIYNGSATINGSITFNGTSYTFGAGAANALITALSLNAAIEFFMDGGGSVISTGVRGYIEVPFACTIAAWTVVSDQNGLVCDIWRANGALPTSSAQSIVGGGNLPQSSGSTYSHAAPSSWTSVSLAKQDVLVFNVTLSSNITKCLVSLDVTRTAA